ncbi:MAG: hypothetical protein NC328_05965 [Muribaculum sp.]|nr:hypothetical protein [Muribaculum sp.]
MAESLIPESAATVNNVAGATGGLDAGNFIETAIDEELFSFNSDDTPLMNIMLKAKRVKVDSPEVDHYMIDEPASSVKTITDLKTSGQQAPLLLEPADQNLLRPYTTVLARGIDGYAPDGKTKTPGKDLLLFVQGIDSLSNNPIVRAVNGPKNSPTDDSCRLPDIPKGTVITILANSLYETQKEVEPDLIVPQPTRIYLQKRGMNQVVSDYFESQRKRIPFGKAVLAEQAIANFKVRGNRTLWAGRAGKFRVNTEKTGLQYVYTTEGLRWQFKRELQHTGKWTMEKLIAMAKMFFTGEDVPKSAILLAGKDLLEQIQCIDFSNHPEIQITSRTNKFGWAVTNFHTVFGDIEIKREPTLDRLGWSNSGALIGEDRIVHYVYSAEHSFTDRVAGEEATRNGILIWDAIALKGTCHVWINGNDGPVGEDVDRILLWDKQEAPSVVGSDATIYYLLTDCTAINANARAGQYWQYSGEGDSAVWKQVYKD